MTRTSLFFRLLLRGAPLASLAGTGIAAAHAQQPDRPADTSKTSLGAVVISATRATTTLEQMPLHATLIGPAQIRSSPAQTLDQLLRDVPGLNMPGAPFYTTDPTAHQT